MQLSLYPSYPPLNVIPSSLSPIPLPAPFVWCDDCDGHYQETISTYVTWSRDRYLRGDSDIRDEQITHAVTHCLRGFLCNSCHDASHGRCELCETCPDCCECVFCGECGNPQDETRYCDTCDTCYSCCNCSVCTNCDRRYSSSSIYVVCDGCDRCDRSACGCECGSYCEGCDSHQCSCPTHNNEAPDGTDKHLVGIEIEFMGDLATVQRALRDSTLRGWSAVYDGSVHDGGELVSPPLDWDLDSSQEALHDALSLLRDTGAQTSPSAGVHVHIDARDLDPAQVSNVAIWAHDWEDQLYRIASSGWATIRQGGIGNYCKRIPKPLADQLATVTDRSSFLDVWYGSHRRRDPSTDHYNGTRYQAVNLHSWVFRGTIEFRVFNSSLSASRISAYVALCNAVVQSAREGKTPKPAVRYALGMMHADTVDADHRYFDALVSSLWRYLTASDRDRLRAAWRDSYPQRAA